MSSESNIDINVISESLDNKKGKTIIIMGNAV